MFPLVNVLDECFLRANMDKINVLWSGNCIRYTITKMMVMMAKMVVRTIMVIVKIMMMAMVIIVASRDPNNHFNTLS